MIDEQERSEHRRGYDVFEQYPPTQPPVASMRAFLRVTGWDMSTAAYPI
jgi:hypothetical protein